LFRKRLILLMKSFEVKPPRDLLRLFKIFCLLTLKTDQVLIDSPREFFNLEHEKKNAEQPLNPQMNSNSSGTLLAGLRGQKRLLVTSHDCAGLFDEIGRKLQWFGQQPFSFLC
jgi:hypothetical protein